MAAKTFESRVEEAKSFVEEGKIKEAVSTLTKAIKNNPELDVDGKVVEWIKELEEELTPPPASPPEDKLDDNEVISFVVVAPFMRNCIPYEVGDKIELPRKNDFAHVKPVE